MTLKMSRYNNNSAPLRKTYMSLVGLKVFANTRLFNGLSSTSIKSKKINGTSVATLLINVNSNIASGVSTVAYRGGRPFKRVWRGTRGALRGFNMVIRNVLLCGLWGEICGVRCIGAL